MRLGTQVHVRVRPQGFEESMDTGVTKAIHVSATDDGDHELHVRVPPKSRARQPTTNAYRFHRVHDSDAGQHDVYATTAFEIIDRSVSHGINGCIFAYGQTGSGKTFSMFGDGTAGAWGIVPRAAKHLYDLQTALAGEKAVTLAWTATEIYNEDVFDLSLNADHQPSSGTSSNKGGKKGLKLQETNTGDFVEVVGQASVCLASFDEFLPWIKKAQSRRTTAATNANATSSRSHCIITARVTVDDLQNPGQSYAARLQFCDLAGSESASATANLDKQKQEQARKINQSLLALTNLLRDLADKKSQRALFRGSALTRLLKGCIGGNCATVMLICVSSSSLAAEQSNNSLNYGVMAMKIQSGAITRNVPAGATEAKAQIEHAQNLNKTLSETVRTQLQRIQELESQLVEVQLKHVVVATEQQQQASSGSSGSAATVATTVLPRATDSLDGSSPTKSLGVAPGWSDSTPPRGMMLGDAILSGVQSPLILRTAGAASPLGGAHAASLLSRLTSPLATASVLNDVLERERMYLVEAAGVKNQFERLGEMDTNEVKADSMLREANFELARLQARNSHGQAQDTFIPSRIEMVQRRIEELTCEKPAREAKRREAEEALDNAMAELNATCDQVLKERGAHWAPLQGKVEKFKSEVDALALNSVARRKDDALHQLRLRNVHTTECADDLLGALNNAIKLLQHARETNTVPKQADIDARVEEAKRATALLAVARAETAQMGNVLRQLMAAPGVPKLRLPAADACFSASMDGRPKSARFFVDLFDDPRVVRREAGGAARRVTIAADPVATATPLRSSPPPAGVVITGDSDARRGAVPPTRAPQVRARGTKKPTQVRFDPASFAAPADAVPISGDATDPQLPSYLGLPASPTIVPVFAAAAAPPAMTTTRPEQVQQMRQGVPVPARLPAAFTTSAGAAGAASGGNSSHNTSVASSAGSNNAAPAQQSPAALGARTASFTRSHTSVPNASGKAASGKPGGLLNLPATCFQREVTMTGVLGSHKVNNLSR
jgi:hypothetical protein